MVKVEGFFRQFSDFKTNLSNKLYQNILDYQLVGSTGHNGEGNDYDVVVLVDDLPKMKDGLISLGWDNESDWVDNSYPNSFISMRKGNFNLLLTEGIEFFQRMKNSAKVIRKVQSICGILNREDVCDIYSIILYGHAVDE